jgi:hypothetical protein
LSLKKLQQGPRAYASEEILSANTILGVVIPLLVRVKILGAWLCILLSGLLTTALLAGLLTAALLLLAGLLAWSLVRIRHLNLHFLSRTTSVPYVNRQASNTFLAS